jgi:hypothetical protein
VSSREAPIAAFSQLIENPSDFEALLEIEAITNPLARRALQEIGAVAPAERTVGENAALIMLPFLLPHSNRFSDGSYGVFYAGDELDTAAAERAYHLEIDLRNSREPDIVLRAEGYAYTIAVDASLHDLRRAAQPPPPLEIYDPLAYGAAQKHARSLREQGSNGVVYESVRHVGSECVGIFRPTCVRDPKRAGIVYFDWDGERVTVATRGLN